MITSLLPQLLPVSSHHDCAPLSQKTPGVAAELGCGDVGFLQTVPVCPGDEWLRTNLSLHDPLAGKPGVEVVVVQTW